MPKAKDHYRRHRGGKQSPSFLQRGIAESYPADKQLLQSCDFGLDLYIPKDNPNFRRLSFFVSFQPIHNVKL